MNFEKHTSVKILKDGLVLTLQVKHLAVRCIQRNVQKYMLIREWPWWKLYTKVKPILNVHRTEEELLEAQASSTMSWRLIGVQIKVLNTCANNHSHGYDSGALLALYIHRLDRWYYLSRHEAVMYKFAGVWSDYIWCSHICLVRAVALRVFQTADHLIKVKKIWRPTKA